MAIYFDRLRLNWLTSSMAARLIVINIAVFIILRVGDIVCSFAGWDSEAWMHMWMLPSDFHLLLRSPWTVLTYMFSQFDVLHCLFNLLWLYGFSRLFLYFSTPRQLVELYIYSGVSGALFFLAGMNLLPALAHTSGWLIGSSAAVMGIVAASAVMSPDMPLRLFLIGEVKLKWVAIGALVLFIVCSDPSNTGGQMAHIGGAVMGALYGWRMRSGHDITRPFNRFFDRLANFFSRIHSGVRRPSFPHVNPFNPSSEKNRSGKGSPKNTSDSSPTREFTPDDQAALDAILDKIKKSGYTALSQEEKRILFDVSKRIK